MIFALIAGLSSVCLFLGMLLLSEIGRRIGNARLAKVPDGLTKGAGAAEAAVFSLLGLLIAFTFSSAANRFEERRHLLTAEANEIGTAYLRVDLLPADAQPELRSLFRRYVDTRSAVYIDVIDQAATSAKLSEGAALQREIWAKAWTASLRPGIPTQAGMLLLPALNDMFDITTTRQRATLNHPPLAIFLMLGAMSLVGALLIGYDISVNRGRSWFHIVVFAAVLSLSVFVILDLEFPGVGLIRVEAGEQTLAQLRQSM